MSNKQPKTSHHQGGNATSPNLLDKLPEVLLVHLCSFVSLDDRLSSVHLTCRRLHAASHHPSSFAGAALDLTDSYEEWRLYTGSSRAIHRLWRQFHQPVIGSIFLPVPFWDVGPGLPARTSIHAVCRFFGAHLRHLDLYSVDIADPKKGWAMTESEVLCISGLPQLTNLRCGILDQSLIVFLDSLAPTLKTLECQATADDFFGQFKQRAPNLASGLTSLNVSFHRDPDRHAGHAGTISVLAFGPSAALEGVKIRLVHEGAKLVADEFQMPMAKLRTAGGFPRLVRFRVTNVLD